MFEEADGGTLFIDEIGDLELPLQAKLLRVIDRGEFRRVGGQKSVRVNVRILAATRRDLDKAVAAGQFRDDLFHRLAVARVELPPLRERIGDIPLLARHFVKQLGEPPNALPPEVMARYNEYHWPGNVRELRNAIARFIAVGEHGVAPLSGTAESRAFDVGPTSGDTAEHELPFAIARRRAIARFERSYVEGLLAAHNGNVAQAARASGLALRYFRLVKARTSGDSG